jgi:hypothetical protein
MDLKVSYYKVTTRHEAYQEARSVITPEYIAKWKVKADISYDDANTCIKAKGKGFSLELEFTEHEARVSCDLSLMLKPFKRTVLETIEGKLKRHI